jgi:hypothetical protein
MKERERIEVCVHQLNKEKHMILHIWQYLLVSLSFNEN